MRKPIDCVATRTAKVADISVNQLWEEEDQHMIDVPSTSDYSTRDLRDLKSRIDIKLDELKAEEHQEQQEQKPKDQWSKMVDLFYQRTNRHVALVNKYAQIIYYRFGIVCAELVTNAYNHDASKYRAPEFIPYVYLTWQKSNPNNDFAELCKTMPTCKVHGFSTPEDIRDAIDRATFHHITTNKHHPESHAPNIKMNAGRKGSDVKIVNATAMDDLSLAEMCADWAAMSEELGTGLVEWAYKNIGVRWRFHPHQKRLIADFLTSCVQNGQDQRRNPR
jgi:hypothetical protein